MSSGITVTDEVDQVFNQLKAHHQYRYVSFRVADDETSIIVDKKEKESTIEEFIEQLPRDQPRYYVYDVPYTALDGASRNRLIFVAWSPDTCPVKPKMVFASSKVAIKQRLTGCVELQANDFDDVSKEAILEKAVLGK